ncbi:MAG: hypothetical protein B6D36_01445 [Planctomycetes bacterium UTPLA1]|nr:MAG: hypothetical protein B6D36_01445 [Planctomycetes bacterium UTPLA1]
MIRGAVRLLMVCLLVGPPALCKAGVLVACCDHESLRAGTDEPLQTACCTEVEDGCNTDTTVPDSTPRKCEACAGICAGAVKPSDESKAAALDAQPAILVVIVINSMAYPRIRPDSLHSLPGPRLPFPVSDVPLLI